MAAGGGEEEPGQSGLIRVSKLSGDCVLELTRSEAQELNAEDLTLQLSAALQISAYRLVLVAGGQQLGNEVLKDVWAAGEDLDLQVLVQPLDPRRCPLVQPGKITEVCRDGSMRVAVTFEVGRVLELGADRTLLHKVVVKEPSGMFPSPGTVFLYDEQAPVCDGRKTLRLSLLGPPSGDLGRRTQGREWHASMHELLLHFGSVALETGPLSGKYIHSPSSPLRAARVPGVARLARTLALSWLLHLANVSTSLWLAWESCLAGGEVKGLLILLSLLFPGLLWQMLCRPGKLVWIEGEGEGGGGGGGGGGRVRWASDLLLFICTPLGILGFVLLASALHIFRLLAFLLHLSACFPKDVSFPVSLRRWYVCEAFQEDERLFGSYPRALLCAGSLLARAMGVPMDSEASPHAVTVMAEVACGLVSLASICLGLVPTRRQMAREAKAVVKLYILEAAPEPSRY